MRVCSVIARDEAVSTDMEPNAMALEWEDYISEGGRWQRKQDVGRYPECSAMLLHSRSGSPAFEQGHERHKMRLYSPTHTYVDSTGSSTSSEYASA